MWSRTSKARPAGKNINPVAGLKPGHLATNPVTLHRAGKNINPVAGLKRRYCRVPTGAIWAGKNINPVAGLKLLYEYDGLCNLLPEKISTQSRD